MTTIKVSDKVRVKNKIHHPYLLKYFGTIEGIVIKIKLWPGELTPENHGSISIQFGNDLESFSYYGWEDELEIIE